MNLLIFAAVTVAIFLVMAWAFGAFFTALDALDDLRRYSYREVPECRAELRARVKLCWAWPYFKFLEARDLMDESKDPE